MILVLLAVTYLGSEYHLRRKYPVTSQPVPVRSDSAGLERGDHLYHTIGCGGCHGSDDGGNLVMDAGPIGLAAGSNLTRGRGGIGSHRSDAELVRAIRHGVRPDGTTINEIMPWREFRNMTDDELSALWQYLRSVPAKEFGMK